MRNSTESYPVKLSLALLLAGIMGHPTFMHSAALASEPAATPISPDSKERVAPRTLKEAGMTTTEIIGQTSDAPTTTPSPASPTTPTDPVYSTIPAQVGGSFTSGPGAGYDRSFVGIDGFVPLMQTPGKDLTYLQGRLLLSTDGSNPGGNVLVGYRRFSPATNPFWAATLATMCATQVEPPLTNWEPEWKASGQDLKHGSTAICLLAIPAARLIVPAAFYLASITAAPRQPLVTSAFKATVC